MTSIVVRRVMPAPPAVVFDEWLDPEGMLEWMCPRPATPVRIELDPRVGGALRIDVLDSGMAIYISGQFTELSRPSRLRFTWSCSAWPDPSVQSAVTVTLEAHGTDETLMTIAHEQLPPGQAGTHEHGWRLIADQLSRALAPV